MLRPSTFSARACNSATDTWPKSGSANTAQIASRGAVTRILSRRRAWISESRVSTEPRLPALPCDPILPGGETLEEVAATGGHRRRRLGGGPAGARSRVRRQRVGIRRRRPARRRRQCDRQADPELLQLSPDPRDPGALPPRHQRPRAAVGGVAVGAGAAGPGPHIDRVLLGHVPRGAGDLAGALGPRGRARGLRRQPAASSWLRFTTRSRTSAAAPESTDSVATSTPSTKPSAMPAATKPTAAFTIAASRRGPF